MLIDSRSPQLPMFVPRTNNMMPMPPTSTLNRTGILCSTGPEYVDAWQFRLTPGLLKPPEMLGCPSTGYRGVTMCVIGAAPTLKAIRTASKINP